MHTFLSSLSLYILATLNCDFVQCFYAADFLRNLEYFSKYAYVARGHWDRLLTAVLVLVHRKDQEWRDYTETQCGGSDNSCNNVVTSELETLGVYRDQSRQTQNTSPRRGFYLQAVLALASRYTYCVIPATCINI
jgi:hypothetical protein